MLPSNRPINLSLPPDWIADIEQRASEKQLTVEEWLYVEIARLLGKPNPQFNIEISKRLAVLESQIAAIPRLENQLQTLISLVKHLQSDTSELPPLASPPSTFKQDDFEEDDDEPDEILYDFLNE
ncbi:MAG: hypothetical protein ACTS2F_23690 [Thainema sp.]